MSASLLWFLGGLLLVIGAVCGALGALVTLGVIGWIKASARMGGEL